MSLSFNRTPVLHRRIPQGRAWVLLGFVLLGLGALGGRAAYLQLVNEEFLQEQADARMMRVLQRAAPRGAVYDRHGTALAMSAPVSVVAVRPAQVVLDARGTRALAEALEMPLGDVQAKLRSERPYLYLSKGVSPAQAKKVLALEVPGVEVTEAMRRFYPLGGAAAQVVGVTGNDGPGVEGVERRYNDLLTGSDGARRVIRSRRGAVVAELEMLAEPVPGQDVRLTIDARLQSIVSAALVKAVDTYSAEAASAVVLDARTGQVLAMASAPTYNPNDARQRNGEAMRNRALTDRYEPGSTLKPFVVAMALASGRYSPQTLMELEGGRLSIGGRTIRDAHPHERLSIFEVLQKSSNVGAAKLAMAFSPQHMWQVYHDIGLGELTGLDFPGESAGYMREAKRWKPVEQVTMSYGHGIAVTLAQVARAYTVFANEGRLLPLSLLAEDAEPTPPAAPVFPREVVAQVNEMLEAVVSKGGTAPQAAIRGYRVGGKTGTTHKIENGRYVNKYVGSFVGLAPMDAPRFIVAVAVDDPQGRQYYGGLTAAPVFATIMEQALRLYQVPADYALLSAQAPKGSAP